MHQIQPIIHHGRLAAIVTAGHAIIRDSVPERDLLAVSVMCLYALEIADGRLPGPYTTERAVAYARAAAAARN